MLKNNEINQRKGSLYFSIGSDYRITTIENSSDFQFFDNSDILLNTQVQNTGFAINYNFDYFLSKNLSIGFSHSMRYGVVSQEVNNVSGDFGAEASQSNLIFGYHFYLDYHFRVFKNSEMFVRFGRSLLNRGTDFSTKRPFQETESGIIYEIIPSNFAFEPWHFALGYKKEKVSFILGAYTSSNTDYQGEDLFVIPYLSFRYSLGSLWNND